MNINLKVFGILISLNETLLDELNDAIKELDHALHEDNSIKKYVQNMEAGCPTQHDLNRDSGRTLKFLKTMEQKVERLMRRVFALAKKHKLPDPLPGLPFNWKAVDVLRIFGYRKGADVLDDRIVVRLELIASSQ